MGPPAAAVLFRLTASRFAPTGTKKRAEHPAAQSGRGRQSSGHSILDAGSWQGHGADHVDLSANPSLYYPSRDYHSPCHISNLNGARKMFRPVNGNHSILDVHFILETERPWFQEDKAIIEQGYEQWGEVLPGKLEGQQFVVQVGPQIQGAGVEHPSPPMPPLTYFAVARDGSREWELTFENQVLRVTCGKYSRWKQVWKTALHLFQMAGRTLNDRQTGIRAVELTYRDLFVWEKDPSTYNIRELLTDEHGMLGKRIMDHGPLWHCHNGWIKQQTDWRGEPYLERIHLDGNEGLIRQEKTGGDDYDDSPLGAWQSRILIYTTERLQ